MKIKTKTVPYDYIESLPPVKRRKLIRPSFLLQTLIRILSEFELSATNFTYTTQGMEKIGKEPCLILMNHSSFID